MRTKILILVSGVIILGIVFFAYMNYRISGTEIAIEFVAEKYLPPENLTFRGFLDVWEWGILSNDPQKKNWEESGYILPEVDFNTHYLIISQYKIKKLYQKSGRDTYSGVPEGKAVFDKEASEKDHYYFYLMPKIMLSQGAG